MKIRDKYISTKCIEIDNLLKDCKNWAVSDPKLGAHLATYANVIILGMLEECFEHIIKERAKRPGDLEVGNYIGKHIEERFKNPTYGLICSILGQFSDTYVVSQVKLPPILKLMFHPVSQVNMPPPGCTLRHSITQLPPP